MCLRTAAAVSDGIGGLRIANCGMRIDCGLKNWAVSAPSAIRNPQSAISKRLQDGADDGARELGADALERVGVLLEEGRGIEDAAAAGGVVLLPEQDAGVLPQHLVLAGFAQLDLRAHRNRIARRQQLRV